MQILRASLLVFVAAMLAGCSAISNVVTIAKYGFKSKDGSFEIAPQFNSAAPFSQGLSAVSKDGHEGFVDRSGAFKIQPTFDAARSFSHGMARVFLNNKAGFINLKGEAVIPPTFEYAGDFGPDDIAVVESKKKFGYIDKTGKAIIETKFDFGGDFSEGLAPVRLGRKWCFIDKAGKPVGKQEFDEAHSFHDGRAAVLVGNKWGFVDKSLNFIVKPTYSAISGYSEGCAFVCQSEKWEVIDSQGKSAFAKQFDYFTSPYSEGLACVRINEKYAFIDHSGKVVIKPKYYSPASFHDGVAVVCTGKTWTCIDKSDKALFVEPFERKPGNFSEGLAPTIGYAPLNEAGPGIAGMDGGNSAQRCIKVSGRISKKSRKMMRYSLEYLTPDGQPIEHDVDGFYESGQQIVVEYNPIN